MKTTLQIHTVVQTPPMKLERDYKSPCLKCAGTMKMGDLTEDAFYYQSEHGVTMKTFVKVHAICPGSN